VAGRNIKGITVEIGGDTTGLQKALQGVNKEIKNTQSQLKDVEKLLKLDPGNTELLSQKQKLLGDAVSEMKQKLATLKTAAEQANQALASGDISQGQYNALQREIIETENALKNLEKQAEQSATAMQKIAATGEKLKDTGDKISGAGEKLIPVTAGIMALGTAAVKTAADFDFAMAQVAAVSGATGDELDALREKAREMGAKTKFSASEAAEAMNYMAMAGWKTTDMLDGIEGIMNLAVASGEDLATTSDIVTDALSAFGLTAADSGHFSDVLAAASSNANTNVSMMGETFKYCAPVAGALGYTIDDVAEAIGLMANSGIKSSQAGTALRTILTKLQGELTLAGAAFGEVTIQTSNADGSMRELSDILADCRSAFSQMTESEAAAAAETLVDKNAMSGFLALMKAAPADIDKLSSAIANCDGTSQEMADTMQDNLEGQLIVLKSQLEELAISFGEMLMPIIRDIVGHIQNFVDKLNSMDEGSRKVILTVSAVVATLGPVLIIIGTVISAVGTIMTIIPKIGPAITAVKVAFAGLNATMASNPIILIIAAIATLVAAFIYLWNNCEGFRGFIDDLWANIIAGIETAWNDIKEFFVNIWTGISETATTIWTAVSDFFTGLWTSITETITTVWTSITELFSTTWMTISEGISAAWTAIYEFFANIWTTISTYISMTANNIWNTLTTVWNNILSTISGIIDTLASTISSVFTNIWSEITATVNNIYNTICQGFNNAVAFIKGLIGQAFSWGADLISNIVAGIRNMMGSVVSAVSNVASTIRSYLHFSVPDVGPLTDFEDWMPDFMEGLADGIKNSKDLVKDAVSGLATDMVINPKFSLAETEGMKGKSESVVEHTGTIRVEGVNDENMLTGVVDIIVDQLRREVRV
jgi:TP901 family phage tail tape measure protein